MIGCAATVFVVLLLQAPAAWLAPLLRTASHGSLDMAQSWGTVWSGSAQIVIRRSSKESLTLAHAVAWHMDLSDCFSGKALITLRSAALSAPVPVVFEKITQGLRLSVSAGQYALPVGSLNSLGAPFNTLKLSGDVTLNWSRFSMPLMGQGAGGRPPAVSVSVHITQLRSQLTGDLNLGDYRFNMTPTGLPVAGQNGAVDNTQQWSLLLLTDKPNSAQLLLSGTGSVRVDAMGTLAAPRFELQAKAANAAASLRLQALLNFLGRRQGDVHVLNVQ